VSPYSSGDCLSRQELTELVNAWVYEHTENHRVIEIDANYVAQWERGKIGWLQFMDGLLHRGPPYRLRGKRAVGAGHAGQFVAETRNRLTAGIAARAEGRARTRDQIRLASLVMAIGDPIEATALGTQALDWQAPYAPAAPPMTSAVSPNPTRATPKWPTSATASAPWSLPDASRRQAGQVNW